MSPIPSHTPRRRCLFVRHRQAVELINFIDKIANEMNDTLALHCDVTIIDYDFNYDEICTKHQPDFVLFESPGFHRPVPLQIANLNTHTHIPRLGISNMDPHDTSRVNYLRFLDTVGAEYSFAFMAASIRQSPELAGRVYTIPQFFDAAIFKNYEQEKLIPLSVFGGLMGADFYPWRHATALEAMHYIPTLVYTHPGYQKPAPAHTYAVAGVEYAKFLNRSYFSLADTTRGAYLVRKHLEIPACGAILVSPDVDELGFYGFHDMKNCILGSGKNLLEKIAAVAAQPDMYQKICQQGHDLVHKRHTRQAWHPILDWYECYRTCAPGQVVQQQGYFGSFAAVNADAGTPCVMPQMMQDSDFTANMKHAIALIIDNQLVKAESLLIETGKWLHHLTEPYLPLAIIYLLAGKREQAKQMLLHPQAIRAARDSQSFYDAEELAWLSLIGLIEGGGECAEKLIAQTQGVRHLGLRRIDALRQSLTNGKSVTVTPELEQKQPGDSLSIHWTGQWTWAVWKDLVTRILVANQN